MPGRRKRRYTHKETADERKNDNLLDFTGYYRKSRLACMICVTTRSRHTSRDRGKPSKLLETYSLFNFEKTVEECDAFFFFTFFCTLKRDFINAISELPAVVCARLKITLFSNQSRELFRSLVMKYDFILYFFSLFFFKCHLRLRTTCKNERQASIICLQKRKLQRYFYLEAHWTVLQTQEPAEQNSMSVKLNSRSGSNKDVPSGIRLRFETSSFRTRYRRSDHHFC